MYVDNENVSLAARMFSALAFCPAADIKAAYGEIVKTIPEVLQPFVDYISKTYVGYSVYKSKVGQVG